MDDREPSAVNYQIPGSKRRRTFSAHSG